MEKKAEELFGKFKIICTELKLHPIILFARGESNGRQVLTMMAGPRFTLESLAKMRADIAECLDAKEKDLKGQSGPDTAHIFF